MIGYLVEQELGNRLPFERPLATLLTMIEVDPADPGVRRPDQADRSALRRPRRPTPLERRAGLDVPARRRPPAPRGAVAGAEAHLRAAPDRVAARARLRRHLRRRRWHPDGLRRPTAAPRRRGGHRQGPRQRPARSGPRCRRVRDGHRHAGASTSASATDHQRAITAAHPDALLAEHADEFAAGSMLPKVTAACDFARATRQARGHRPARRHRSARRRHRRHPHLHRGQRRRSPPTHPETKEH